MLPGVFMLRLLDICLFFTRVIEKTGQMKRPRAPVFTLTARVL